MARAVKRLTSGYEDIMQSLDAAGQASSVTKRWVTPQAVGGTSGSAHSYMLRYLSKLGYVEMKKVGEGKKGSNRYRLSAKGSRYVKKHL